MRCFLVIAAAACVASQKTTLPADFFEDADDTTTVCWKDSYGRGVGRPIHTCAPDKERDAGLCYKLCRDDDPTFYGIGPVCWQHCRDGYVDEGALCRKQGSIITYAKSSYGRGVGIPLGCAVDEEYDAGLCYKPCRDGYYGIGPICWEHCGELNPSDGGAICCRNATLCSDKIKDLAGGLPLAVAAAILAGEDPAAIIQSVIDAINSVLGFI
eukprot:CAMPEP_0205803052 /NCGR_PEP_ID=MMETSP0205-20121125/5583_1 /ASSEMBLY_ACC=CAM_ASM_000278 /TAXON_ID=36767 /ORGANISM="Euplotes focardii, Strain TN1" /LENGTH=211 /DNA_ID=CAMNT_0053070499 /DNA_START=32 /DNA_END=664 /DNA_ORIENTATION=+